MSGEDLSDERLILMFRYGNRAAFDLLFEKHRDAVFNFARRMLRDRSEAEDVCQETFLRLVSAAASFEPRARFRPWLFTIARNCCLNVLRRKRPAALSDDGVTCRSGDRDATAGVVAAETNGLLECAIGELAENCREAFLLRFRHEMSYEQIAEVTGQPLGTVKTHIHRARLELARKMRDKV